MKKALFLIFILTMIAALSACSTTKRSADSPDSTQNQSENLTNDQISQSEVDATSTSYPSSVEELTGTFGKLTWSLSKEGALTLSGQGYIERASYLDDKGENKSSYVEQNAVALILKDGLTSIGDNAFNNLEKLRSVKFENRPESIGNFAFNELTELEEITIPDSVTSIRNLAFSHCEKLTEIIIPDNVTSLGTSAFSGCAGLKSIKLGNGLTDLGTYVFDDCENLESIEIPDSVTHLGSSFHGCTNVKELYIGSGLSSVTKFGFSTFNELVNLQKIEISENNDHFAAKDGMIFNKDFTVLWFCPPGRTEFNIPSTVTKIATGAFSNCKNLHSIAIPANVEEIGESAFSMCTNLTQVDFGHTLKTIRGSAFNKCGLTAIRIPLSVTLIESGAFNHCDIKEIYYEGSSDSWEKIVESNNPEIKDRPGSTTFGIDE